MVRINDKGHFFELDYKPNNHEWGFLRKFLSEEGLVVKTFITPQYGSEGVYHFSRCTIYMNLTPRNHLNVRIISDNKRRAKKTADELDYKVMMHELCKERQSILS